MLARACALGLSGLTCSLLSLAGCVGDGGAAASPSSQATGGVEDGDAGLVDAAPNGGDGDADEGSAAPSCSSRAPSAGMACFTEGTVCEYGASAIAECDTLATCAHGKWQVALPDAGDPLCTPAGPAQCPASRSDVPVGQTCTSVNLDCDYAEGRCECAQNLPRTPGWPAIWKCPEPGSGALDPCPPLPRPRLGTPCDVETVRCDYGACEIRGGVSEVCSGGVWTDAPFDCFCPAALPRGGAVCSRPFLQCEYGSSTLASCDTVATCSSTGQWFLAVSDGGAPCAPAPASDCPPSPQPLQGTTCTTLGLDCDYGDMRCECNNGPTPTSEITWRCDEPVFAGAGCGPRPRLGTPCPEDGLSCDYGTCEIRGGGGVECDDVWFASSPGCLQNGPGPPSSIPFPFSTCSAQPPEAGVMCFEAGMLCEYGSSHVVACDTTATCSGVGPMTTWVLSVPDSGSPLCTSAPSSECPASFAAVPRGTNCTGPSLACDYPEGRCQCAALPALSQTVWSCQDPPAGCPLPRPPFGSSCVEEGLVCPYDPCGTQGVEAEMCRQGSWTPLVVDCTADAGFEGASDSGTTDAARE
jgi:hypothetical protein